MIELKDGTKVWNKSWGTGIVTNPDSIAVWFENKDKAIQMPRESLFARGDVVEVKSYRNNTWDQYYVTELLFYAHLSHNPDGKKNFTVLKEDGKVAYVYAVRHAETIQPTLSFAEQAEFSAHPKDKLKMIIQCKQLELEALIKAL